MFRISANDFSALSCAYTAENLGFPGHDNYETAQIIHHKDKFRAFAEAKNITIPKAISISKDRQEPLNFNLNFPLMVKPVDLSGGRAVVKMLIRRSVALDRNTEAAIKAHGVMGERYAELVPLERSSGMLKPGGTIERTRSVEDFSEVSRSIKMLADSLSGALGGEGERSLERPQLAWRRTGKNLRGFLMTLMPWQGAETLLF